MSIHFVKKSLNNSDFFVDVFGLLIYNNGEVTKMFKDRLKEARQAAKLTQAQVASAIGVAKSTYAGYETGNSEPDLGKIEKLLETLRVDANYLWQDEAVEKGGYASRLSFEEAEVLNMFRDLDKWGKELVLSVLKHETRRCQQDIESLLDEAEEAEIRRRKITG